MKSVYLYAGMSMCLLACLSVLILACDPPPGDPLVVPTSDVCNHGLLPMECTIVPPRSGDIQSTVEGATMEPGEYYGAVELPITNLAVRDAEGLRFAR